MTAEEYVATYHGVKILRSDEYLHERRVERIRQERYEWQEVQGALHAIKAGDRVLELGSGIGIVGSIIAKNCNPEKIVSFEANPNLIPYIKRLYAANDLDNIIQVRNQIVDATPEPAKQVEFHVHASYLGSSLIKPEGRKSTPVQVPVVSYQDVIQELSPNVIVSDIEGGELELLRHADLSNIRAAIFELHPGVYGRDGLRECRALLESAGLMRDEEVSSRTVVVYQRA